MRPPPLLRLDRTLVATWAALATAIAAAAACSGSAGPDDPNGAVATEAGVVRDASPEDASDVGADAAANVDARAPDEIVIQAPGASFAIDTKEISVAQYILFRNAPTVAVGSITGCEWKTSLGPAAGCAPLAGASVDLPITCIDWCDAQAYCMAHGKRLCARIGGGSATPERLDPLLDEWSRACGGPMTADRWPYGTVAMGSLCNTVEHDAGTTIPSGSLAGCTGAPPALSDMSGNAAEWEDSCVGDAGAAAADRCAVRGGSFSDTADDAKCSHIAELGRAEVSPSVGARCCKDLQQ